MTTVAGEPEPDVAAGAIVRWRGALVVLGLTFAALVLLYWDTLAELQRFWSDDGSYDHVILLGPISVWLIWQSRARLAALSPTHTVSGVVAVTGLSMLWAVSVLVDVQVVQQLALLLLLEALVLAAAGWRALAILAFPIGLLVFAVPVWTHLVPVLQDSTANVSVHWLRALGVPVYQEGYYLTIPNGRFVVAEVCAGLRFLIAMMCVTALYGYLNFFRASFGFAFFAFGVFAGVVSNWARVVAIILIGHYVGMDHPLVGAYHTTLGWFVFAFTMVPVFLFGAWMQRFDTEKRRVVRPAGGEPRSSTGGGATLAVLALGAVLTGPAFVAWAQPTLVDGESRGGAIELPALAGWSGPVPVVDPLGSRFVGADSIHTVRYSGEDAVVDLIVAGYARQRDGAEVVSGANQLYDRALWTLGRRARVSTASGQAVLELELDRPGRPSRTAWQLYRVAGRITGNTYTAKVLQVWGLLVREPGAQVITISTDARDGHAALAEFLRTLEASLGS